MSNYSSQIYKDGDKYRIMYRYASSDGKMKSSCKRGFKLLKDAKKWQSEELPKIIRQLEHEETLDENLTMSELVEEYLDFIKLRRRDTTYENKANIILKKIVPFFKNKKVYDVSAKDVAKWDNYILSIKKSDGTSYAATYQRSISNQLSAILNYAVTYHNLPSNPVLKVERIGKKKAPERDFWTVDEYTQFIKTIEDEPMYYYAFELLFWCGIREGELLALTPKCFNFKTNKLTIVNSYHRAEHTDIIGDTKNESSKRTITMPANLTAEIKEYLDSIYCIDDNMRIFPYTKFALYRVMKKGSKSSGVKRIPIHSLRHSHITLLQNSIGCATVMDIANRAGQASPNITMIYSHRYEDTDAKIADELNKLMDGDKNVSES